MIEEIWKKHPNLRFYQLLEWIHGCPKDYTNGCLFAVEDDEIEEELEAHYEKEFSSV